VILDGDLTCEHRQRAITPAGDGLRAAYELACSTLDVSVVDRPLDVDLATATRPCCPTWRMPPTGGRGR
jgi:hypothetical protein